MEERRIKKVVRRRDRREEGRNLAGKTNWEWERKMTKATTLGFLMAKTNRGEGKTQFSIH